jgi:hypothetical protein
MTHMKHYQSEIVTKGRQSQIKSTIQPAHSFESQINRVLASLLVGYVPTGLLANQVIDSSDAKCFYFTNTDNAAPFLAVDRWMAYICTNLGRLLGSTGCTTRRLQNSTLLGDTSLC